MWAAHAPDGRLVALKILRASPTDRPDLVLRFDAEGRLLRELGGQHHLIRCDAVVASPPTLVLELAGQGNLRDLVEAEGPLAPRVAVMVLLQAAEAVTWLHHNQVIHRDVKPSNLVAVDDGSWRLVDLGVAAHGSPPRGMPEGWVEEEVGTPGFAAPELLADPSAAGAAIDVFGLGATLAFALSGRTPDEPSLGERRIPARLLDVVQRSTAPDLAQRYPTALEMRAALARALA